MAIFDEATGLPVFSPRIDATPNMEEIENLVRDSPKFKDQLNIWDKDLADCLEASKRTIKSAEVRQLGRSGWSGSGA